MNTLETIQFNQLLGEDSLVGVRNRARRAGIGTAAWNTAVSKFRQRRAATSVNTLASGTVRVVRVQQLKKVVTNPGHYGVVVYQNGFKVISVKYLMKVSKQFAQSVRDSFEHHLDVHLDKIVID